MELWNIIKKYQLIHQIKRRRLAEWAARCNQLSFIPELVNSGVIQKLLERENMTMIVDAAYYMHIQFVRDY